MPILDCGKREKMVQLIANGEKPAPAYRAAFNSKAKPETIHVNSCKVMKEAKVALRLAEVKQELAEKELWTREDSVRTLSEIAKGGDPDAKPSDRVNAVKAINQMHGWDKTTVDHTSSDGSMAMPSRIELVPVGNDNTED